MSWIGRLWNLMRGRALDRGLDEELSFHIEARVRDNVARGMTPRDARHDASLRFGNQTLLKERTRDMDIFQTLETGAQDLRYAVRSLFGARGFAITAILSLALGIGASTAIFSIADSLLLRPLPYPQSSRLLMLWEAQPQRGFDRNVVSPGNYLDWKKQSTVFETMAAFEERPAVLTSGDHTEELGKQSVSAELLPMLGVKPVRGRLFTREEDSAAALSDNVLIISYRVWQSWFAGDENIIGRQVQLNSVPRTIIGVLPPDFYFWNRTADLWEPLGLNPAENYRQTQGRWMHVIARLEAGATRAQAQAEMTGISQRLASAYPDFDNGWTVTVESLRDALVRDVRRSLLVLLAAVGFLLAVACANVANLLLARFAARRQEIAVRTSLGAGRRRIIRQVLTESLLLAIAGGCLGAFFARSAIAALLALAPQLLTQSARVSVDLRVLVFAIALSALTGVVFGLGPSLITSQVRITDALNNGSRSSTSSGQLRNGLVTAEVALAVMLLAGAGLLFRSMIDLQSVDPGLNASGVLTFRVAIPAVHYHEVSRREQFFNQALQQLSHIPGVESASAVSYLPFSGLSAGTGVSIAGKPNLKPGEEPDAVIRSVMPGYFHTLGIPLTAGRDFTDSDNREAAPHRFIVNRAFVRKYLRGEDPLGLRVSADMDTQNPFGEIVGVVGDVREQALDKKPLPTVYYIYAHLPYTNMNLLVRSNIGPQALAQAAGRIVRGIDPAQPIAALQTMEEMLGQTFARQRFSALLLSAFSVAALLLAGVGIYGLLAYSVSERSREIGVRIALGAEPGRIVALVLGAGLRLVCIGITTGVAGALLLSGLLKSLLFGVGPQDPLTFFAAPALLAGAALLAACLPAVRAARVDPMNVLRAQ